jgi:II/X family phage/plasmid replication protein
MLDTVKLRSPSFDEATAREIERLCVRRSALHMGSGEVLYELTTGQLEGSYDHKVSVRVERVEKVPIERDWRNSLEMTGKVKPEHPTWIKRPCEPYLLVEGSVHKAMLGHNVYGGPESFQEPCEWLVADVGRRVGVELPRASEWLVRRVDWSEVYELPDYEAVEEYVWGLNSAEYPRRSVVRYGREGIMAPGRTTTVKAYHKGLEFAKHDSKRLKSVIGAKELHQLQDYANKLLRWEVETKAKKLDEKYREKPRVDQVSAEWLRDLHYTEVRRLVREGEADVKAVRKQKDVRDRLLDQYDRRKAGLLLGTWHQLATLGEHATRRVMAVPRPKGLHPSKRHDAHRTFRRHKQLLMEAGVSWIGADVVVVPKRSTLPDDFSPNRNSPYRVAGEDPAVVEKLAPYRAA